MVCSVMIVIAFSSAPFCDWMLPMIVGVIDFLHL